MFVPPPPLLTRRSSRWKHAPRNDGWSDALWTPGGGGRRQSVFAYVRRHKDLLDADGSFQQLVAADARLA